MLTGTATKLESQFRLTYAMMLKVVCFRGADCKFIEMRIVMMGLTVLCWWWREWKYLHIITADV